MDVRYLVYINCVLTCSILILGLSMPWSVYEDAHIRARMDIYGITVCRVNVTVCITTNGGTDLSRACRNLEMLYIFGSGLLIILNVVGGIGVWAGAWIRCNKRVLGLIGVSIGFLLGSYMSVDKCGQDWNVPVRTTLMYRVLV